MSEIQKYLIVMSKFIGDTDIKALPTTAIEIIPTPGMNKIIIPMNAHIHIKSTVAYTNFDPLLLFSFARGIAGGSIFTMDQADTILGSAVDIDANMIEQPIFDLPADIINKGLNLKVTNGVLGNFTGGAITNLLNITVSYWIKHV